MPATGSCSLAPFWNVTVDRVADLQVEVLGRVLVDEDAAVGEVASSALDHAEVDELLEGSRVDGAEVLLVSGRVGGGDLGLDEAHAGHRRQLGQRAQLASATSAVRPWNDPSVTT